MARTYLDPDAIQDRSISKEKLNFDPSSSADIVELKEKVNTNTSNIATNTSNIATNTSNIATNTSNIATNTSNINSIKTNYLPKSAGSGNPLTGPLYTQQGIQVDNTTAANQNIGSQSKPYRYLFAQVIGSNVTKNEETGEVTKPWLVEYMGGKIQFDGDIAPAWWLTPDANGMCGSCRLGFEQRRLASVNSNDHVGITFRKPAGYTGGSTIGLESNPFSALYVERALIGNKILLNRELDSHGNLLDNGSIITDGPITGGSIASNGTITSTGDITANGDVTANKFINRNSSDDYVLLGKGGTKALSLIAGDTATCYVGLSSGKTLTNTSGGSRTIAYPLWTKLWELKQADIDQLRQSATATMTISYNLSDGDGIPKQGLIGIELKRGGNNSNGYVMTGYTISHITGNAVPSNFRLYYNNHADTTGPIFSLWYQCQKQYCEVNLKVIDCTVLGVGQKSIGTWHKVFMSSSANTISNDEWFDVTSLPGNSYSYKSMIQQQNNSATFNDAYASTWIATSSEGTWAKLWSMGPDELGVNSTVRTTLSYHLADTTTTYYEGLMNITIRRNSSNDATPYNYDCSHFYNIVGNAPLDRFRIYYDTQNGGVSLWYKLPRQWAAVNIRTLNSNISYGQAAIGTWYNTTITSSNPAESLPDLSTYVTMVPQPVNSQINGDLRVNGNITATGEITAYSSN